MNPAILEAAHRYSESAQRANDLQITAEPEAQLTTPVDNLFSVVAKHAEIGELSLVREAQLDGVRPDFAAVLDGFACGWIELKRPGHSLDGTKWTGREKEQWSLLAELDSLIVTDGQWALLYNEGVPTTERPIELPMESPETWEPAPLISMLSQFSGARPATVRRVSQLARKLAPLARLLRLRLQEGVENRKPGFDNGKSAWDLAMQRNTTDASFASDVAQVLAYSMAIAGLQGGADKTGNGVITVREAADKLHRGPHNVLAAALGPVLGIPDLMDFVRAEVGGIERLVSAIDPEAIHKYKDARGEPWLWFYEDFLAHYDPVSREKAGVYYTPSSVVQTQVRLVDHILKKKLERNLGFGAESVTTLDPAAGSGTYPLAVIDFAERAALERRGDGGRVHAGKNLRQNLIAFELLPGPYAVSQLRIGERLSEVMQQVPGVSEHLDDLQVFMTDTLEDPSVANSQPGLFGDALVLSQQADKARRLKHGRQVTVVIGNPPYDRVTSNEGGWVTNPRTGRPLFDDVIKPAQEAGVIFSAQASLYNMYVYFWRWALWKAFEEHPDEAAVVSFIAPSKWLSSPVFVGLRQLVRTLGNEVWVLDLGGEGLGARPDINVFDIVNPVAIVTVWRRRTTKRIGKAPAKVFYQRVEGTREEKFQALDRVAPPTEDHESWEELSSVEGHKLAPVRLEGSWASYPLLTDIFPWQQPGMMTGRAWNVSPSKKVLERRWEALLEESAAETRAERYVTPSSGRNIFTRVGKLQPIAELPAGTPPQPMVRTAWRSFDRQWIFEDRRLIKTESPALWRATSEKQIFLVSLNNSLGEGPAVTLATEVPDKHYFRGSYGGKDIMPLYRDADSSSPNLTQGLLELLTQTYERDVTPEDLAAYVTAVIGHDGYAQRFSDELASPGARVPLTKDPGLFERAVAIGEELIWLQTYGQRFTSKDRPRGEVPLVEGIQWRKAATRIPNDSSDISYDAMANELRVADGIVTGVTPSMRDFSISGMNVLDRWLGARTHTGLGRSALTSRRATHLDRIRPTEWEDAWNDELLDLLRVLRLTLDRAGAQDELLEEIVGGALLTPDELPTPTAADRKVPKV